MERSRGRLMLIKLTNAHIDHLDKPLLLNADMLVVVFPGKNEQENDVTFALGAQGSTWQVKETIDEIMAQIKG